MGLKAARPLACLKWQVVGQQRDEKAGVQGAHSVDLEEECDVLVLVMSKYPDQISLSDFRAVMLATLRPLRSARFGSAAGL